MNLHLEDLMLEVTRKCNLTCDHCLRGCAENEDMSKEVVDNLLSQVSSIGCIAFSGGEPTLNMDIIEYVVEELIKRDISVNSFYVATNGVIVSKRLAMVLLKLNAYTNTCGENISSLDVSIDEFHGNKGSSLFNYGIYQGLSFFNLRINDYSRNGVVAMGNAIENGLNARPHRELRIEFEICEDEFRFESDFYVNVKGNYYSDFDYSYSIQEDEDCILGNVTTNILDNLMNVCKNEKKVA